MSESQQTSPDASGKGRKKAKHHAGAKGLNGHAFDPALPKIQHTAEVAHATRGRVRLKIPKAKDNLPLLVEIKAAFEGKPGIDAVNVKPATGSLVIYYDPELHPDISSLFIKLGQGPAANEMPVVTVAPRQGAKTKVDEGFAALEEEAAFLAEHSSLARSIVDGVKALDRQIKLGTNNAVDLKIVAPVGLAALTFLEIGAAAATPMWVTLVIFSMNHYVEMRATKSDEAGLQDAGKKG